MMARPSKTFVCQECGGAYPKWSGRCDACGAWNTLVEEAAGLADQGERVARGSRLAVSPLDGAVEAVARLQSGIGELDRVVGGGFVPGSVLLVGGDPGIGKSTLLLQAVAALSAQTVCIYVSGEEAVDQLRLRAARLGVREATVGLAAATAVRDIATTLEGLGAADVVVIDSVQTLHFDALESAPGTVAQVRACAQLLIALAKRRGFVLVLVGHVTKEGTIAGPRVLEHMVDTVLYFEGERGHHFRILRAVKNRFGATDEIGVFEMTDAGLKEVANPSALFLSEREREVPGSCVFAGMEGTRPVLVEIQALIAPSSFSAPRRAVVGWDSARLAMILAVLEARCGLAFGGSDVFLNVAGGLRIGEPAADLAVAAALVSAARGQPLRDEWVVFGEIGLGGEVRAVARTDSRLKEAAKLGFNGAILPARRGGPATSSLAMHEVGRLSDLLDLLDAPGPGRRSPRRASGV
jgi:DNA repair protein RadA/Sms